MLGVKEVPVGFGGVNTGGKGCLREAGAVGGRARSRPAQESGLYIAGCGEPQKALSRRGTQAALQESWLGGREEGKGEENRGTGQGGSCSGLRK